MTPAQAAATAAFCYESAALLSGGRLPTISALCAGRPWWIATIPAGALFAHLILQDPRHEQPPQPHAPVLPD